MSLFVCDKCHCVENTALGRYHSRNISNMWADDNFGQALCSECAPLTYKSGEKTHFDGTWHGKFSKRKPTCKELREVGYFIYVPENLWKEALRG